MSEGYERKKESARQRSSENTRAGQEIGPPPKVQDARRRKRCGKSFRAFCETYCAAAFPLAWSADHLKVIERIERAILEGGLFALAMPRGSGKTTLCERAALWALLYAHRRYVVIVGATRGLAVENLAHVKAELTANELLAEDFPETIFALLRLENEPRRCRGQTSGGERTNITWATGRVVLPTIAKSRAAGSVISVCGLTGALRGQLHRTPDGKVIRPDLCLLDDPQTRRSAASPSQCASREAIVAGDVLGMAGPGQKLAAVMPCTVIAQNDLADKFLDRQLHPRWQGERTQLVYEWPARQDLWREYGERRSDELRAGGDGSQATKFYRAHRREMDAGARVAWAARKNPDELSALQHAVNLRLGDERAFFAEYQNDPLALVDSGELVTAAAILARQGGQRRGVVPLACERVTAFIDVQDECLFWLVAAWSERFDGQVLDYATFPDQETGYFTKARLRRTFSMLWPGAGREARIFQAVRALAQDLLGRVFKREDGAELRITRGLVDAQWGEMTDTIYKAVGESGHADRLTPSHGRGIRAGDRPLGEAKKKPGERVGLHWRIPPPAKRGALRHVSYDANYWKSFVHSRLAVAQGDPGSLTLWRAKSPDEHRLFADHLTAEYRVPTEGRGRKVDEWRVKPERADNDFLDCLAGAAVAASIEGISLRETGAAAAPPVPRLSLSALQAQKRAERRK